MAIPRCYPNLAELTPVCECRAAPRPRASATPIREPVPGCITSATVGSIGRRPSRVQCPPLALQLRLSCPTGRQNARWARRILPSSQAGPNPLGENITLSSPPLEPRGLLLSVMRQKVGKERSQGVFAPLANPHRFLACPLRKFGPSPTPPEAALRPGRQGRAMQSIATGSTPSSAGNSP